MYVCMLVGYGVLVYVGQLTGWLVFNFGWMLDCRLWD